MVQPSKHSPLFFPKIISGRIDDAVRPRSEWRQWLRTLGLLDARAHLFVMPSACEARIRRRCVSPKISIRSRHSRARPPKPPSQTWKTFLRNHA